MSASNPGVCVGPNLLSPAEEHTLPLEVLLQVTGNVFWIYQLAAAFQAHPSFAVQRYLAASSLEKMLMLWEKQPQSCSFLHKSEGQE